MKRKILILLCAVCFVLSFSVTAFASTTKYPVPPNEGEFIIYSTSAGPVAFTGSSISMKVESGNTVYYAIDPVSYRFNTSTEEWEKIGTSSSVPLAAGVLKYDSTGRYLTDNLIELIKEHVRFEHFTAYYDGLKGQITVQNVVGVLVVGVGAVIGIVFTYWGIRKGVKALMSAFRKGKISL